jgi:hypothetical protein
MELSRGLLVSSEVVAGAIPELEWIKLEIVLHAIWMER